MITSHKPQLPGKISTQSLANQAKGLIRTAIFEGAVRPEEKLTIERIAADLGISRTPVREALKALEADGIVRILPNRGAVVQRFNQDEIFDRYSVRALLEGYAGELACRKRGAELAAELNANCRAMEAKLGKATRRDLEGTRAVIELNMEFHNLIIQSSGSTVVSRLLETLRMPVAYRIYHWRDPVRQRVSLDFHRKIAAACRARRPKQVRRALEEHIIEARDFLLSGN